MFCEKGGVADGMHFTISPAVKIPNEAAQRDAYSAMEPNEMEPESQPLLDNSLTSLGWLQNLKVFDMFSPEVRVGLLPPSPCSEDDFSWETVSSSSTSPDEKKGQLNDETFPLSPIHKCIMQSARFRNAPKRYRNNPAKPPFSFTSLIYLAIQHSRSGKATLHDICRWIKTNFKYFRSTESPWQNSIRHSLTLSELFTKVPRSHGDSSKGSYWTVDPRWKHILSVESNGQPEELTKGMRKRAYSFSGDRRPSGGMRKRAKSDNHLPADPCGLPGDLDWVSLLSSQRVNCGSCPSQACRPVYGSPILGPPDLGQVGDPMVCSPLILPTTLSSDLSPQTPVLRDSGKGKELEEVVWKQDSPSPHLLPWADSQPQSPCLHPWAESKETTLRNLHRQSRQALTLASQNHTWSPETSYSSSCSTVSIASLSYKQKKIAGESYIY